MKKYVIYLYIVVVAITLLMAGYIGIRQNNKVSESRYDRSFSMLEYYNFEEVEDASTPAGIKYVYEWQIEDVPDNGASYTFYAIHQNAYYYINGELVASLEADENNLWGHSTYSDWATCFVSKEDSGKKMHLEIVPLYSTSTNKPLSFYFGDYSLICRDIISKHMVVLIIGLILVIIGIGFFVFGLMSRKNVEADRGVLSLGVFSIFAGIWKLTDMRAAPLIFGHPQLLGFLTILMLALIVVPYLNFIQLQFKHKNVVAWTILGTLSVVQSLAVVLLQMFNVLDVRETLILTHIVIIICIISVVALVFIESRHARWSTKLTVTVVCSLLCLIGTCLDMLVYYLKSDSGTVMFCITAFLIYIVCMGFLSVRETKQLMEWGKEAKHYQQIAMHDGLTGLFSRAFYNEYLSRNDFSNTDCSVIMFDMNHLKKSNDNYGHAFGDQRLKDFAEILNSTFSEIGKVCRFGGDEFCVLIRQSYTKEWKAYLNIFEEKMKEYNEKSDSAIPLSAAYGYATFDAREDDDFSNTMRRADKMMYEMKVLMKMERKEDE